MSGLACMGMGMNMGIGSSAWFFQIGLSRVWREQLRLLGIRNHTDERVEGVEVTINVAWSPVLIQCGSQRLPQ